MAIDLVAGRKKPVPRTQRASLNRAKQFKRDDTVKDISVSLMDMDSAIMYYFENVIKPTVIENGETVKVPIMYSSPERWFAIQKSGFMRDSKRQVIIPVIAFRRTGMEKDETYCDLIIKRWEDFTGQTAKLLERGTDTNSFKDEKQWQDQKNTTLTQTKSLN